MITVGMNYHVLPGKQRDFEEKFSAVMNALRSATGHTHSSLWKDVSDDASYLITSEWSDEQAFLDFIHSQAFRLWLECFQHPGAAAPASRSTRACRGPSHQPSW